MVFFLFFTIRNDIFLPLQRPLHRGRVLGGQEDLERRLDEPEAESLPGRSLSGGVQR